VLWLPDDMSKEHVALGELVPLFKGWRLDPMPLYVAFPPNRHVSAKLRMFIEWIAELMAQHAPVGGRRIGKTPTPIPRPRKAPGAAR
jgi:DNA-binding transcriptional LysR family regulator